MQYVFFPVTSTVYNLEPNESGVFPSAISYNWYNRQIMSAFLS